MCQIINDSELIIIPLFYGEHLQIFVLVVINGFTLYHELCDNNQIGNQQTFAVSAVDEHVFLGCFSFWRDPVIVNLATLESHCLGVNR